MIEASEHFYHDDPNSGPADVRTELPGVDYYFLGNGLIQAAIQVAPRGGATPLGLLVMNPDRLRKKRDALTMDPDTGLAATMVRVGRDGGTLEPAAGRMAARWLPDVPVPTVEVKWTAAGVAVTEQFSCPAWSLPALTRVITVANQGRKAVTIEVTTGVKRQVLRRRLTLRPGARRSLVVGYRMNVKADQVKCAWSRATRPDRAARTFWTGLSRLSLGRKDWDHFFAASTRQLPVAVSRAGCIDGSIWQYNLEWMRDQAMIALGLAMIGATGPATTVLSRLLDKFVTPDGDTLDSSVKRDPAEVELDQNGVLLCTLRDYVLWTGNLDLVRTRWKKVVAAAEFPLKPVFRHPESGLLVNCREYWERHKAHGIEHGMELSYQAMVAHGLEAGAVLARLLGHPEQAARWDAEAKRLLAAMLDHPRFRMHDERGFIKRRAPDGAVQETITAWPEASLPREVPLGGPGNHRINPDTSCVLPIALGLVAPDSPVARRTFASMERLWNQDWKHGGYGRYDVTSEPDSPGSWPFASLFVARAAAEAGDGAKVGRILDWLGSVAGANAGTWFEFYGRRLAPPFPQVGIVVWNWAELVILYVRHILGVKPEEAGLRIQPRLLEGVKRLDATLTFRGQRLTVKATRKGRAKARFAANVPVLEQTTTSVLVPYGRKAVAVSARV
ncbi:MAG: hypothetical protein JSR48_10705 [Verrucomicrobia bacterium]|nr:hypothetical protein [Verrucomicrobiota bacterium]